MSIIGEVLVHYRRHGALYSVIPAHSGRNIRRHKSNNSPRSSSLKAALPKCYHQVSSKPGASRLPGHGITITKIFYFKSISCCDQTDSAIAHFIKLWLGFRSLGFREPFTMYSLPLLTLRLSECPLVSAGQLLFAAWIFMRTKSLWTLLFGLQDDTKVVPSVRWIHNGMAWGHKSWLPVSI